MNNDKTWWKDALAGKSIAIDVNNPHYGFYRTKWYGNLVPVAYWYDQGQLSCLFDGKELDEHRARERWPFASKGPITYAAYQKRIETGRWDDIDPIVHEQAENTRAVAGGNNPPTDPAELLAEQIASASAGADAYKEITDDETLAKAQTLRSRLLELHGQADKHREALKRPHLDAGAAIDARWQPIVKGAKAVADKIRSAMEDWQTKKLQKQRAEEAARAAAQRAHDEAVAKAAREAAEAGKPAPAPLQPPQPPAAPMQSYSGPIKGAAGRAASSKPKKVVTEITNIDALFYFLKDHPEVKPWLMALAQRAVDSGRDVPGVKIEERAKVV